MKSPCNIVQTGFFYNQFEILLSVKINIRGIYCTACSWNFEFTAVGSAKIRLGNLGIFFFLNSNHIHMHSYCLIFHSSLKHKVIVIQWQTWTGRDVALVFFLVLLSLWDLDSISPSQKSACGFAGPSMAEERLNSGIPLILWFVDDLAGGKHPHWLPGVDSSEGFMASARLDS